jgi:hypothetical protein
MISLLAFSLVVATASLDTPAAAGRCKTYSVFRTEAPLVRVTRIYINRHRVQLRLLIGGFFPDISLTDKRLSRGVLAVQLDNETRLYTDSFTVDFTNIGFRDLSAGHHRFYYALVNRWGTIAHGVECFSV